MASSVYGITAMLIIRWIDGKEKIGNERDGDRTLAPR
jgi:hypothetical protein